MEELIKAIKAELREEVKAAVREELCAFMGDKKIETPSTAKDANEESNQQYLTANDVVRILHCSRSTLCRWQKNNRLVPVKLGKKVLYKKEDIDDFVNNY